MIEGRLVERQRLVLDCRQTNQLFRPSPHTELGSLACLTELDIPDDSCLFVSGADIQDCFYAVHIPVDLMSFFCLEGDVSGEDIAQISRGHLTYADGSHWTPCFNVLPMGFSWSFYLVQRIHQLAVIRSLGIDEKQLILDGRPPPIFDHTSYVSMPYCDNIHSLALSQKLCDDGSCKIIEELKTLGFSIHEEEAASTTFATLGGEIDGEAGKVKMTRKRAWDLILAFEFVADHMVHPTTMQRLLGHAMFFSTLNRSGMSVFRRCFDFVEKGGEARFLGSREREECLNFAGIIPLLFADIRRHWSSTILCTDASPSGYGICEREVSAECVSDLGRWNERWRFKRLPPSEWAPRRRAMGLDPFSDPFTVVQAESVEQVETFEHNSCFPEVPPKLLNPSSWRTVLMGKWKGEESITIKEGRALVLCLRRLARSSHSRGKKHVILVDNLALSMAISKGRAKSFPLLRITQQVAALTLVGNFGIRLRWVPSELNVADGPSRGQFLPGAFKGICSEASEEGKQTGGARETAVESSGAEKFETTKKDHFTSEQQGEQDQKAVQVRLDAELLCKGGAKEFENSRAPPHGGRGMHRKPGAEKNAHRVGKTLNLCGSHEPVPEVSPDVQEFLPGQRPRLAFSQRGGQRSCRLFGRDVFREPFSSRRREDCRSSRVQRHQFERKSGEVQTSIEGVAKGAPAPISSSTPQVAGMWHGNDFDIQRATPHGIEAACRPRHLSPTWRKHRLERKGRHPSSKKFWEAVPMVCSGGQGHGGPEARQNWYLRQHHSLQQQGSRVSGQPAASPRQVFDQHEGRSVPFHQRRVPQAFSVSRGIVGSKGAAPLSNQAWRCVRRPEHRRQRSTECQDTRPVANRPVLETLRKSGQSSEVARPTIAKQFGVLSMVEPEHGKGPEGPDACSDAVRSLGWTDVFTLPILPKKFALEIFAGTARLCGALREVNIACYPVDICIFPSHNVLSLDIEHRIVHWVQSHRISFIWLGLPCTSFSKARKWDGLGPGPLRDHDNINGFPWLSLHDRHKVWHGNELLRFTIRIMTLCEQFRIPYALENPYSSYMWHMPGNKRFIAKYLPYVETLDFCQYGGMYKKPTTILGNFWPVHELALRCTGRYNSCSMTHRPHSHLTGQSKDGIFKALLAQPYPRRLADRVAQLVTRSI